MRFIGLDVHKRVVQAHIADQAGAKLGVCRFELSARRLDRFAQRYLGPDTAIALEATTNTWAVVDALTPHCGRIVVSNPLRTKAIASAKIKTDKVDAEVLAHLLRLDYLPPVWQPDVATRQARALASRRGALTRQSITLKNRIQSVLHQRLIEPPNRLFGKAGRAWLASVELPALERGEVDTLLHLLDTLAAEQRALQAQIDASAVASEDMQLLMTLPGVDVTVAQGLVAAIGPIERFTSAASLTAYLGLVPSVRQSAARAYYGRITKRGNTNARWLLVQAAHVAARHPGPLGAQFRRLKRRKSHCVAIVALARKLAVLSWHLLTHREPYRYALPATVEAKFARLRRTQQIQRLVGPKKGTPRPPQYGSGIRTRGRKSLDAVLRQEGLPATQSPPPAEKRVVNQLGLLDFSRRIQSNGRVRLPVGS
ncbi:MAG: IS110 family transposase [Steroidobacteraceae bacterium]